MKLKLYIIVLSIFFICLSVCLFNDYVQAADSWWDIASSAPTTATANNWWDVATQAAVQTTSSGSLSQTGAAVGTLGKLENPDLPTYGMTWDKILQNIYSIIAFFVGSALVIMFLVGGVMYITSAGNEEQASKGAKTVTAAVIGFVMIALAYGIITFVAQLK